MTLMQRVSAYDQDDSVNGSVGGKQQNSPSSQGSNDAGDSSRNEKVNNQASSDDGNALKMNSWFSSTSYDPELMTPMLNNNGSGGNPNMANMRPSSSTKKRRVVRLLRAAVSSQRVRWCVMTVLVVLVFLFSLVGLPFPDRRLPELPPLPANPRRAFASLHSDSNPCYDMLLFVCLSTWQSTKSKYPMLVLHSIPLPEKVQALIDAQPPLADSKQSSQAGRIIPVSIPVVKNFFVLKDRVRTAAAKFAVWDQTEYDQVAYFDSDSIFFDSGDSIFDCPVDHTGNLWLYARPYAKYWARGIRIFNSGNFLIRPSVAVYHKILELFERRFWILSLQQFFKTADQGFLNAVFSPYGKSWDFLESPPARAKHVKLWLAVDGESRWNVTAQDQKDAVQIVKDLALEQDMETCRNHRRYSD